MLQAISGAISVFALVGWQAFTSLHSLLLILVVVLVAAGLILFRVMSRR